MTSSATFIEQASAVTVEQWRSVYDSAPLGFKTAAERLRNSSVLDANAVVNRTLGNPQEARNDGRGGKDFVSVCCVRLMAAIGAVAAAGHLSGSDFVSGYGPFLELIPPEKVRLKTPIGDLADVAVRSGVLARYRQTLAANPGQTVIAQEQLDDKPHRIATAIVLESVNATKTARARLADELVQLCCFTGDTPREVHDGQLETLRWLGYSAEGIVTLRDQPVAVGVHTTRVMAGAETFQQWFYVVYLLVALFGLASCSAYTAKDIGSQCFVAHVNGGGPGYLGGFSGYLPGLISCGPGLLGLAGVVGGYVAVLVGWFVTSYVEKRTEVATRARSLGRAAAIIGSLAVAAISLVPAFIAQR